MALDVGDAATPSGLAGEIFTALDAAMDAAFSPDYDADTAEPALIAMSDAIAGAVVAHIIANIELNGVSAGGDTVPAPNAVT
jgi:hypothetical protein